MTAILAWGFRLLLLAVVGWWLRAALRSRRQELADEYWIRLSDPPPDPGDGAVTVVIPARNEVHELEACVRTVLDQDHPAVSVLIFDDASTDGTDAVARRLAREHPQVIAVHGEGSPPEGWLGKPWALHRARRSVDTPWILFVDADVRLHPEAVSRSVDYARRHGLGMLSGYGTLVTRGFWETLLQPIIAWLIVSTRSLARVNDPERKDRVMANGQFLLFRRESYRSIGGHEAVQDDVLDDVGLARAAKRAGIPYHCVYMRSLFSCRMYRGLGPLWRGWRKNLYAGMDASRSTVAVLCFLVFLGWLLPYPLVIAGVLGWVGAEWLAWGTGLLVWIHGIRFYLDRLYGQPPLYGLLQPLAMILVIGLFLDSAWRSGAGRATWKGRVLPPPRPGRGGLRDAGEPGSGEPTR